MSTVRFFFTGRGAAIKRRIQTGKGLHEEDTNRKRERRKLQWRWFSGWSWKIHSAPLTDLDEAVSSASSDLKSKSTGEKEQGSSTTFSVHLSQPEHLSYNQALKERRVGASFSISSKRYGFIHKVKTDQ